MKRGITLIELLVIIVMIALLLSIAIPYYRDWRLRWSIESDAKDIYAFLQKARAIAFSQKRALTVIASGRRVCMNDGTADIDCINLNNSFTGTISITDRGVFNNSSIYYNGTADVNPAYSCVVATLTRVRLGVYDGTNCNAK